MLPFGMNFSEDMTIPEDCFGTSVNNYDPKTQIGYGYSSSDSMVRSRTFPSDSTETEKDD